MKYCKHCNVKVDSSENYCPLCYNYLEELEPETDRFEYYLGRDGGKKRSASNHFLLKLFLYISVCISVVCFTVNYFTEPHMLWSPVVFVSVLYLWILIGHTILSKRSPFEKIFFQFVGLVVLLIFLERLSMRAWFLDYVLPSILLAASSVMALISLISKLQTEKRAGIDLFRVLRAVGSRFAHRIAGYRRLFRAVSDPCGLQRLAFAGDGDLRLSHSEGGYRQKSASVTKEPFRRRGNLRLTNCGG